MSRAKRFKDWCFVANENQKAPLFGVFTLDEPVTRAIRNVLTREEDGTFDVCEDHERRMRTDSFDVLTEVSPNGMSLQAVAHITCGHSKRPCVKSERVMIVTSDAGINPEIVAKLAAYAERRGKVLTPFQPKTEKAA
jgi:hypothetical protein